VFCFVVKVDLQAVGTITQLSELNIASTLLSTAIKILLQHFARLVTLIGYSVEHPISTAFLLVFIPSATVTTS